MPTELTVISLIALLAGLVLLTAALVGRRGSRARSEPEAGPRASPPRGASDGEALQAGRQPRNAHETLRVVWWLTIAIVLLGVGVSGSFATDQAPIFLLGAVAVASVVVFHEVLDETRRGRALRALELVVATAIVGGLLALTGFASSPFAMLFALVAVAAALAHGPGPGFAAAGLATAAFGAVLLADPRLASYGADDALRLSIGLGATWLLAFVAIAYARHQRRTVAHALALSRTDSLTGLFNRSQLFTTLEQEVSRTRRSDRGFCLLMIDLDGLKAINDDGGHLRGDDVLRDIGSVIRRSIRAVDSAYRYGGDEFVVLLPETDIVGAFVVAEKIRAGAEEVGLAFGGPEPVTSVSIGLVSHPEDGFNAEDLMAGADRAMYQAKKLGKNQISGNPRPRPALIGRRPAAPEPQNQSGTTAEDLPPVIAVPTAAAPHSETPAAPPQQRAVAVDVRPEGRGDDEEDLADPQVVRRQIAAASRSFDPDHQIRRAMDAFLSPASEELERVGRTPDH